MPFKSKAQQRWMFAAEDRGEVPEGTAHRWADETKSMKTLPDKVKKAYFTAGQRQALTAYGLLKVSEEGSDRQPMPHDTQEGTPVNAFTQMLEQDEAGPGSPAQELLANEDPISWGASAGLNSGSALERGQGVSSNFGIDAYGGV